MTETEDMTELERTSRAFTAAHRDLSAELLTLADAGRSNVTRAMDALPPEVSSGLRDTMYAVAAGVGIEMNSRVSHEFVAELTRIYDVARGR